MTAAVAVAATVVARQRSNAPAAAVADVASSAADAAADADVLRGRWRRRSRGKRLLWSRCVAPESRRTRRRWHRAIRLRCGGRGEAFSLAGGRGGAPPQADGRGGGGVWPGAPL